MASVAQPANPVYMSLDVGDARIGVALSRSGVLAEPLLTVERIGRSAALDAIEEIVESNRVSVCVVGLPLLENGTEGEQAAKTRKFARSLARRLPALEITFWDERHSSAEAAEIAGKRIKSTGDKGLIDRIAAAVILREYLDFRNERKKTTSDKESGT